MEFPSELLHRLYRLGYSGRTAASFPVPEGTVYLLSEGKYLYLPSETSFPLKKEQKDALPLLTSFGLVPEYLSNDLFLFSSPDFRTHRADPIRDYKELTSYVRFQRTLTSLPAVLPLFPYEELLDSYRLRSGPSERVYMEELETSPLLKKDPVPGIYFNSRRSFLNAGGRLLFLDPSSLYLYPSYFLLASFFTRNRLPPSFRDIFLNEVLKDPDKIREYKESEGELIRILSLFEYHFLLAKKGKKDDPELERRILHFRKGIGKD